MRTPPNARRLRRLSPSVPVLAALAAGLALPAACSDTDPETAPAQAKPPSSSEAAASLARSLTARFPAAFGPSAAPRGAAVSLPRAADLPLKVRDDASKIEVAVSLIGASSAEGAGVDGSMVFAGAAPQGGDLVLRPVAEGAEDLVHFAAKPRREALEYHLDLGAAAGLRLVDNTLEVLDKSGIPVLRAAPPYVLDASGRHEATLSVEGCAADTSPVAPFRRPVTPPGADRCTVKVDWSAASVRYPALVDPIWGTTFNAMAAPRAQHTITLLNPASAKSLALVAGGVSSAGGAPLKSAEIYDPLSRRFSSTGSMATARSAHSATAVTTLVPGLGEQPVLVAGGRDMGGNPLGSLEVYHPPSGTFIADSNTMAAPRFEQSAVLVGDKEILIAGGTSPPLNQPTNTAYLYTFVGFGAGTPPSGVTSTLELIADSMESARTGLAMTRLTTGKVLLTGGFVLAGGALQALNSGEVYEPVTRTFSAVEALGGGTVTLMATARGYHTSTALGSSGAVLIAGGLSKTVGGTYTATADIYFDGSNGQPTGFGVVAITMANARANHSATLLPDGRVLVAGGFSGSPAAAIGNGELFDPQTSMFSDLGALAPMSARGDHAALLVNAGDSATAGHTVLVTGGSNAPNTGSAALSGAQILLRINGDPCTVADECLSGFCTDGVCCDTLCDEECFACSAATKETGADGTCSFAKRGSDPHVQCINQVETHTQCDGKGSTEQTPETHSCKPAACGADNYCSPGCDKTADCDETGWCDLTTPGPETAGLCSQKKVNGAPCYGDDQCVSAFCVDGVCCGTQCDQQCQACDLPGLAGTCQTLGAADNPQDVHPNTGGMTTPPRTACDGFTGDHNDERTACTGACRGKSTCDYPDGKVYIQADDCKDDPAGGPSALTKFPCDGAGSNTEDPQTCAGFRCADANTCKTSCAADTDCITDFVCLENQCTALTGPLCDGKDTIRQPAANGGYQVCPGNYACPDKATACLTECDSIHDCVTRAEDPIRYVCNGARQCVPEPEPLAELPACSASSPGHDSGRPWWLAGALGGLAALLRRRRK